MHTTGTIGDDQRNILVVFTTYTQHTTWPQATKAITRLCQSLSPLVPDSAPNSVAHWPWTGLCRAKIHHNGLVTGP